MLGEHRHHLAAFRCATTGQPFTLEVEQEIRSDLAGALERGIVHALGSWDGDRLGAVIAFSAAPGTAWWRVHLLATDHAYRRRKQALRLKYAVLSKARDAGADAVISRVHRDNHPMLALNRRLGGWCASTATDADGDAGDDDEFLACAIPLRGAT
ncbi:MAG TPA: GNAT family N-acetyltransferase [Acidimicrobiales bacterium]